MDLVEREKAFKEKAICDLLNAIKKDKVESVKIERKTGEKIYLINLEFHFKKLMDSFQDHPDILITASDMKKHGTYDKALKAAILTRIPKIFTDVLLPCKDGERTVLRPIVKEVGCYKTTEKPHGEKTRKVNVVEIFVYESVYKEIKSIDIKEYKN